MSSTVIGTLTVNLEAQTASFTGDLGKASGALKVFADDAADAGNSIDYSMREARGSMALLGDEIGVHIPRHLQTLIAELPGVGAAFSTMLPIVGVVAAVALIDRLIEKNREAANEMAEASTSVSNAVEKNASDTKTKLLELAVQFDNLTGNHAKALTDELKRLDAVTLQHLGSELEGLAKLGDKVFASMQKGETSFWFGGQWNSAAAQVKSDLDAFNTKLQLLVDTGTKSDVAAAVVQHLADVTAALNKEQELHAKETGHVDRIAALQQELTLAQALTQEYSNADKVENSEKTNIVTKSSNDAAATAKKNAEIIAKAFEEADKQLIAGFEKYSRASDEALEKQLGWQGKMAAAAEASTKAQSDGIEKVRKSQEELADAVVKTQSAQTRDDIKTQADLGIISKRQEMVAIAALDQQELQQARTVHQQALAELETHLAAMKAAQESAKGGDGEAAAIDATTKAQVALNTENSRFITLQSQLQTAIKANEAEALKLSSSWAQYFAKMHSETQDLGTVLKTSLQNNINSLVDGFSSGISKMIIQGKNFGQSMREVAVQISESMISEIIKIGVQDLASKLLMKSSAASLAGANATASMAAAPFPLDMGAPGFGAAMMGTAMGFAYGGEVPGSGFSDSVPAMLTPGETVVTKALTDQVKNNTGGSGGRSPIHIHMPNIQALDADGVDRVLDKHATRISKRIGSELRKMNRR